MMMMMTKPFGVDYTYMTHYIWRGCGAWWQIVIIIIIIRWTKNLVRSIDRFLFSFGCWCFIYLWLMDTWWIYDDSIWYFSRVKKNLFTMCVCEVMHMFYIRKLEHSNFWITFTYIIHTHIYHKLIVEISRTRLNQIYKDDV